MCGPTATNRQAGASVIAFSLRYAGSELSRRWARAAVTALGLGAGVSLVVAILSLSAGFDRAGNQVMAPLGSVGTDVLVTQTADSSAAGGGTALVAANRSVVTDLASLGPAGSTFTKDFFLLAALLPVKESTAQALAGLPHVRSAAGALTVLASHQTGVVPKIVARLSAGGQTLTASAKPAPLTSAEAARLRTCILPDAGLKDLSGLATGAGAAPAGPAQIEACLPDRYRAYVAQVKVPYESVRQVLNPPQTNIRSTTYTVAGVDPAYAADGLVTPSQVASGRFVKGPQDVMANVAYAQSTGLRLGSTIPINGVAYHVVGLVNASIGGQSADLYLPLTTVQRLTGQQGQVNVILVHADSANAVEAVTAEIHRMLPSAHLVSAAAVAKQVKSSINDARKLSDRFGGALAAVSVGGAFLIAILLTLGSVAKRVREIGTLRAIGWSRRRVVGQLVVETLGIGAVGGLVGMAMGAGIAAGLTQLIPSLDAHAGNALSSATSLSKLAGVATNLGASSTMHVRIIAEVTPSILLLGGSLALLGGLLAGVVAGWRASCLAPALALRDIG